MKMGEDPGGTSPSLALGASVTGMVPVDKRPVCAQEQSGGVPVNLDGGNRHYAYP